MQKGYRFQNNICKYSPHSSSLSSLLASSQKRDIWAKDLSWTKSWEKWDSHYLKGAGKEQEGAVYLVIFPSLILKICGFWAFSYVFDNTEYLYPCKVI